MARVKAPRTASSPSPEACITPNWRCASALFPASAARTASCALIDSSPTGSEFRMRRAVPVVSRGSSKSRMRAVRRLQKDSSFMRAFQRTNAAFQYWPSRVVSTGAPDCVSRSKTVTCASTARLCMETLLMLLWLS